MCRWLQRTSNDTALSTATWADPTNMRLLSKRVNGCSHRVDDIRNKAARLTHPELAVYTVVTYGT